MREKYRKSMGVYLQKMYILAFNCPIVANLVPYKTVEKSIILRGFLFKEKSIRFIAAAI